MKIVVIADEILKKELLEQGVTNDVSLEWRAAPSPVNGAAAYIDLLFDNTPGRLDIAGAENMPVIVNAVNASALPASVTRINGWKSFLKRPLVEAYSNTENRPAVERIFSCFHKTVEWVPDVPGFISARVVSMIINEAWYSLDEKVSTKEAIDTAMKLGTNYPYGPFEWGNMIGLKNIVELLTDLSSHNPRYKPAALLQQQVIA